MTGSRRDWLMQIDNMQREMERLLDHFAGSKPPIVRFARRIWEPAVDVYETDNEIVVNADIAGVAEDELEITVSKNVLTIRGARRNVGFGTQRTYYQMEIASGAFERIVSLPVPVDPEKSRASYNDGLVEVLLPKSRNRRTHTVKVQVIQIRRVL